MDIGLHKHSVYMNILQNPDEGLQKRFAFRCTAEEVASAVPAAEFRE